MEARTYSTATKLFCQINKQDNRKLYFRLATSSPFFPPHHKYHIQVFLSLTFFISLHLNVTFCVVTCFLALHALAGFSSLWILASTATRSRMTIRSRRRKRCAVRAGTGRSDWRCGSCGTTRHHGRTKHSCSPSDRCLCLLWWTSFHCA